MNQQDHTDSLIQKNTDNKCLSFLRLFDFFSFIPVPKDLPVSTRHSMIGSILFIVLFLSYVIYDFYKFVALNPAITESYFGSLDKTFYTLPRFAITFMKGYNLDETQSFQRNFDFEFTQEYKDRESKVSPQVSHYIYQHGNANESIISRVEWLDHDTRSFYHTMRTPAQDLSARGLLYSVSNASYAKVSIKMCDYDKKPQCDFFNVTQNISAQGRIFLFVENVADNSSIANPDEQVNKFLIYNFFLIPYLYKRATIKFQVVHTYIKPDYFFRFFEQETTRLEVSEVTEQTSNTSLNDFYKSQQTSLELLSLSFQLSAKVLHNRITYSTLLDHVSNWGAFWGVLFGVFALVFLGYNRKKYYKKNEEWANFKEVHEQKKLQASRCQEDDKNKSVKSLSEHQF